MAYVIIAKTRAGVRDQVAAGLPDHLAYLDRHLGILLGVGPFQSDDGSQPADGEGGGLFILDVEDRNAAETFMADEPFNKAGLFETIEIRRWHKAYFDGAKLI